MDKIVFYTFYNLGVISKRVLAVYEDSFTAVLLERNDENRFV